MGGVFKKPKPPKVERIVPPTMEDPAVAEARREEELRQQLARGRASTLITGAAGDTSAPDLKHKTLLGA